MAATGRGPLRNYSNIFQVGLLKSHSVDRDANLRTDTMEQALHPHTDAVLPSNKNVNTGLQAAKAVYTTKVSVLT